MAKKYTKQDVLDTAERLKNWGRWGPDDEVGAVNFITSEDIVAAARLVRRGQVSLLGLALDQKGPQAGLWGGRWNPIHTMLATGTDAVAGKHDASPCLRYGDDAINLPASCHHPGEGRDPRRDGLPGGPGRRLRRRPHLRALPHRPAAQHHPRHRLHDQPARDQVIYGPGLRGKMHRVKWSRRLCCAPPDAFNNLQRLLSRQGPSGSPCSRLPDRGAW